MDGRGTMPIPGRGARSSLSTASACRTTSGRGRAAPVQGTARHRFRYRRIRRDAAALRPCATARSESRRRIDRVAPRHRHRIPRRYRAAAQCAPATPPSRSAGTAVHLEQLWFVNCRFLMKGRFLALILAILGVLSNAPTTTPPNASDQLATAGVSAQQTATDPVAVAPVSTPVVPRDGSARDRCLYNDEHFHTCRMFRSAATPVPPHRASIVAREQNC
jgi:hypothetical protein